MEAALNGRRVRIMFSLTKRQAAILLGVVLLVADNSYFALVGGFSLYSNSFIAPGRCNKSTISIQKHSSDTILQLDILIMLKHTSNGSLSHITKRYTI